MTETISFNSIALLIQNLTGEEQVLLVNHAKEFKEFVEGLRGTLVTSNAEEDYIPDKILVRLTVREKDLLVCLLKKHGKRIIPTAWPELYLAVYKQEVPPNAQCPNRLRVLIALTRKKIAGWAYIRSRQKVGNWLEFIDMK